MIYITGFELLNYWNFQENRWILKSWFLPKSVVNRKLSFAHDSINNTWFLSKSLLFE